MRKQLRVGDVTEYVTFGTFPRIMHLDENITLYDRGNEPYMGIVNSFTGEYIEGSIITKKSTQKYVKKVNKSLKEVQEYNKDPEIEKLKKEIKEFKKSIKKKED